MGYGLMRALALSLLLLFSQAGFTKAAVSDNDSTDVMNLNYYPHPGFFDFNPQVTTSFHDSTTNSNGGSATMFYNIFNVGASYGFGPRLRVHVEESFLWDQNTDSISAAGVESEATSQGLSNPTLALTWRYLEDGARGLSGDFSLSTIPSLGPKIIGDGALSRNGNNLSGATTYSAALTLYWRHAFNEMKLAVSETQNMTGTQESATTASQTVNTDAYLSTTVTLADRIHFGPNFFVEPGATAYLGFDVDQNTSLGVQRTSQSPFYVNPQLLLGFQPDHGTAVIFSMVSHDASTVVQTSKTGAEVSTEHTTLTGSLALLHQY
jgi:hypothetical protein